MSVLRPIDVAKRWQCSERHVRNLLTSGELRGFKAGGKLWRTRSEWVEEYERCQNGDLGGTGENGPPSEDQESPGNVVHWEKIVEQQNG